MTTVAELIQELKKYPADAVAIAAEEVGGLMGVQIETEDSKELGFIALP